MNKFFFSSLIFIFCSFILSCNNDSSRKNPDSTTSNSQNDTSTIGIEENIDTNQKEILTESLLANFQGDWTCIFEVESGYRSYVPDAMEDPNVEQSGIVHYLLPLGNVQIIGNEISTFSYPCQCQFTTQIENRKGNFMYEDPNEPDCPKRIELSNDTLIIRRTCPQWGYTKYYIRDAFDKSRISSLKEGIINPDCLKGNWELIREDDGGDGSSYRYYSTSFDLPDTLYRRPKNYRIDGKYLIIPIDGKQRKCEIAFFYDFDFHAHRIRLKPAYVSAEEYEKERLSYKEVTGYDWEEEGNAKMEIEIIYQKIVEYE